MTRGLEVQRFTPRADNELFAKILAAEIFWDDDLIRFANNTLCTLDANQLAILAKYGYTENISGKTHLEQAATLIDDFQRAARKWRAAGGNNYLHTEVIGNGYQGTPIRNLLDQQERDRQQFLAVLDAIRGSNLGLGALGYAVDGEDGALFWGAVGDILSPFFQGIGDKAHYDSLARQAHGPQSRQEIHGTKNPRGGPEREAPPPSLRAEDDPRPRDGAFPIVFDPIPPLAQRRSSTAQPAKSTPAARGTTKVSKGLATPAPAKSKAPTARVQTTLSAEQLTQRARVNAYKRLQRTLNLRTQRLSNELLKTVGYRYQVAQSGKKFEYVLTENGNTYRLDDLIPSTYSPGKFSIVDSKWTGQTLETIDKSAHVGHSLDKAAQITRVAELISRHPNELGELVIRANSQQLLEIFANIIENDVPVHLRSLIHLELGPW